MPVFDILTDLIAFLFAAGVVGYAVFGGIIYWSREPIGAALVGLVAGGLAGGATFVGLAAWAWL